MVLVGLFVSAAFSQMAEPVITSPRQITAVDVSDYYPPEAMAAEVEGLTRLKCRLTVHGTLERCELAASSGSASLDTAAFRVAGVQRYVPATIDGVAREIPVVLPVRWKLAE